MASVHKDSTANHRLWTIWLCVCLCVCWLTAESSINNNTSAAATTTTTMMTTANGDLESPAATVVKTAKLTSSAWCVCRWLISCMKKDEPVVGATTFQNSPPKTPPVSENTVESL